MRKIIISIGASMDHFGAYAENCEGVYGAGNTAKEAVDNAKEGLRLLKESRPEDQWPDILKGEYEFVYRYDIQSILNYYLGILKAPALERLTGVNQKQLHHYASGLKMPREQQKQKIIKGLHALGRELMAAEL
ncbi:type II toxin-antitoxin system HicB family antitoxin [Parabacteroides sp. 52]|uniref:type II toxin-antitoxin system HicB family antitoxin n=1 Tax=unclassified Parabacteroides TaxID=2649774 RepID=UPI0013CF9F04|nr:MULTISPECIES: type II toxin-antitoxin system HicB family antitoxin [unclassified Parabacteroides]MDH6535245.1 putative RNase H-like HicB family nuclease [Parabacteroides sp. PM5-20]NDV55614.1 type II toxin-antitoxin system HicB family antitoxin [Parabacteroides sp. 52]